MKGIRQIFAGLAALFALSSCGNVSNSEMLMQATILQLNNGSVLVGSHDDTGAVTGDLYSFSVEGVELVDDKGNSLPADSLTAGQTVEIRYDGYVRESYPAGITCSRLTVTGSRPEDWVNPVDEYLPKSEPDPNDPYANMPSLGIEYQTGETVSCTYGSRGTSDWYENGEGICVDSVLPFDQKGWEHVPVITRQEGCDFVTLLFSKEPDSASAGFWTEEGLQNREDLQEVELENGTLSFPEKGEKRYYQIAGEWEEGSVTYYFVLE